MPNPEIDITILPSGLTVACRRLPYSNVEYCGIVVKAGSRDDGADSPGLAHFVEHTIFKGTQRRSSFHIINRMERVGGELNAYTTKEETVVYTAAPRGNVTRAMDLIADLAIYSRFPECEIEKEREVVADEISSYLDTPSEAVYDDFEDIIYADTPLGHNILGTTEALNTFNSEKCRNYLRRWYTSRNMAVFYLGPSSPERVLPIVERCFEELPQDSPSHHAVDLDRLRRESFNLSKNIDSHQAHTVMGAVIPGIYGKNRYPMALLTNILGGPGMNSLLNVQMREKRGLVYSVEASTSLMSDCGLFTVYFGCDRDDTRRCEKIVRKQIEDIACGALSDKALASAKKQYLGQLAVASDSRESVAISTGRAALYYQQVFSRDQVKEKVNGITIDDIREAAKSISDLSLLTLL